MCQWQRVTKRNQVGSVLGGHDPGQLSHGEHIALLHGPSADLGQSFVLHSYFAFGHRHPFGVGLAAHVHHPGIALRVEVREFSHEAIINEHGEKIPRAKIPTSKGVFERWDFESWKLQ